MNRLSVAWLGSSIIRFPFVNILVIWVYSAQRDNYLRAKAQVYISPRPADALGGR
ncbi:hypothetical protein BDZ94DRAFT_1277374 [Collybia nuda]|uniref:Uncharacterized protein n=1 Tax=Collybia nuda TaxID=64659 RepID=A0A9P5XU36_9AGAR|nr:hypothetical protein BDZ94DRAFT_1277431 [Collybia nuda]KAF9455768.1 hypothetical protein BDZ94DRAFT_1277374 [Collybia nuda]